MQHEWVRRGMHVGYWWESRKERDQQVDQDVGGWIILKYLGIEVFTVVTEECRLLGCGLV
jgi:hypothetical protein